jgi:hypothetical protein
MFFPQLTSSAVDQRFEPLAGKPDYKIDICCFSAKQAALRSKSKDWLTQNQDYVSERSDIYLLIYPLYYLFLCV